MLKDTFGRIHDYLRISLTDKCNMRCSYCMPDNICFLPNNQLLTKQEIIDIAKIVVNDFVLKKIRFTGGEPLLKKDVAYIIETISRLPVELAITTNGILLNKFIPLFENIGLKSINISMDSLIPERFNMVTKQAVFHLVKENIDCAIEKGFNIKLNTVVMNGVNEDEINDFIEWTRNVPVHVRFIEFMPFDGNKWQRNKVITFKEILDKIEKSYSVEKLKDKANSTSKSYRVKGFAGTFAVISSITTPFCDSCNRLRLTADGKLRSCLFATKEFDLLTTLRKGEDIRPMLKESVISKAYQRGGLPEFHNQQNIPSDLSGRSMVMIGG